MSMPITESHLLVFGFIARIETAQTEDIILDDFWKIAQPEIV